MAAKEKSQDEKNLKILRELAALPANKYCFDCQQRGPTYINVTVGSFVCTACSGILRGLNPPHRIKSITMASFATEEMEQIKNRGNEHCKQVWLGKYDSQASIDSEYENITKIREFMILKYEEKKYYIEPDAAAKRSKPRAPSIPANSTITQSKSQISIPSTSTTQLAQKPGWVSQNFTSGVSTEQIESGLFRDLDDPFKDASKRIGVNNDSSSFADFGSAFGNAEANIFSSQQVTSSGQFGSFSSSPVLNTPAAGSANIQPSSAAVKASQKKAAPPPPDRYAALADLDNQLHQQQAVPNAPATVPSTVIAPSTVPVIWSSNTQAFGSAVFDAAAPNPFNHTTPVWTPNNLIPSANPFQGIPQSVANPLGKPVPVSGQATANGLPNSNNSNQHSFQNGAVTSTFWPAVASQAWSAPFQNGQADIFQNKSATAVEHYNPWAQSLASGGANPFLNGSGIPTTVPRTNTGKNPFL